MSMPTRQERILARMAHSLHASEPRLTSMFAIFTRLTRDEDMPGVEALDACSSPFRGWRQQLPRPKRQKQAPSGAVAAYAPGARLRAMLLVPIMLAALVSAVFLALGGPGASRCGPGAQPQHSEPAPSRHQACPSVPQQRWPSG